MKFQQFLEEGLTTGHGKVEMAIRELGLKYTIEDTTTAKIFHIGDFKLTSKNNGEVILTKGGATLGKVKEYNFNKIRTAVVDLLKDHVVDAKEDKKEKETEAA